MALPYDDYTRKVVDALYSYTPGKITDYSIVHPATDNTPVHTESKTITYKIYWSSPWQMYVVKRSSETRNSGDMSVPQAMFSTLPDAKEYIRSKITKTY